MKQKLLLKSMLLLFALIAGSSSVWATDKVLTFDLSSNPGEWPTANSTTLTNYTYTLSSVDYTFALKNVKCNSGYLMMTATAVLGLPAIDGYKLTKVVASNSSGCSTSTVVGISSSSSAASYISGGATKTWSTTSSSYTYTLSSTEANTMYYLYVTSKNAQVIELELTYAPSTTCAAPTFYPVGGKYKAAQNVALGSTTADASIYYTMTTDGTDPADPTESSTLYSSAISVSVSGTKIKAKAFKTGLTASTISSATYTITPDAPTFSPVAGHVAQGTEVTMTVAAGCFIKYTTDGSDPASSGTATLTVGNTATVTVDAAMTIRAITVDAAGNQSTKVSAAYTVSGINEMSETKSSFTTTSGTLSNDISFASDKGGAGTAPGNYNNGIRLYQISGSNPYGGFITLSAPSGFSIKGFSITSTSTYATTVNYTVGNYSSGFDGTNYSLDKSSEYSIFGLNCSSVNIYNVGTGSSGRLEIGSITVYYEGAGSIAINSACTDGEKYYGTYSNPDAFIVPSGLTVSEINVVDGKLSVSNYAEGAVVPKNTGVMVSSTSAGNKAITFTGRTGSALGTNLLKPSGNAGIDADGMAEAAPSCKYYRLTMHNGTTLGFYWGAADGAAFALGANKAYLAVPSTSAPAFFEFGNTTGINEVRGQMEEVSGEFYNLNGQRVAQPTKGLYIVNGKKVIIK